VFNNVLHVSFPFSLWNGFTYPYVLRQLQRVHTTLPVNGKGKNMASFPGIKSGGPIREKVADLVKKINLMNNKRCINELCEPLALSVKVSIMYKDQLGVSEELELLSLEINVGKTDVKKAMK